MKIDEIIKIHNKILLRDCHNKILDSEEVRNNDEIKKCLTVLQIILKKKVDIYSEFILNEPENYDEYKLYHEYRYNVKTKLSEEEYITIKEALNDLT